MMGSDPPRPDRPRRDSPAGGEVYVKAKANWRHIVYAVAVMGGLAGAGTGFGAVNDPTEDLEDAVEELRIHDASVDGRTTERERRIEGALTRIENRLTKIENALPR